VGTGSVSGMLAEMLAAGINNNTATIASSALHVEEQVLEWFRSMLGLPAGSSGLLVSGGSVANLIGIAVARTAKAGVDTKRMGVRALPQNLVLYCSEETHNSVDKAASLLGLGTDWVRKVPTDDDFRIRVEALEEAIRRDLEEGHRPFCIVGNAGTVGTGATDDLSRLADVAERFGLWLHVDGAIGAVLALSPALCPRVRGIERADSVAFDLHKWMYMPYAVGGVLVRDREAHHRTFASSASYLGQTERGPEADAHRFHEFGLELSRSFGALKVWMLVKEHGVDRYTRLIEQNVGQAAYLAGLVEEHPELELLAPAPLNIVCFRYRGAGIPEERLDAANREILTRLQERGIAVPSGTRVRGRFAIRTAITNHRSRRSDFDLLAESVVAIGREVAAEVSGDI
ncbi:MAG TPA: pyridoxal-dependent decarboxylase, partial [Longimicrobiaceae bacterium]|nr:pyridoxal-dependent decarboxylase [Longimicrobiaceae bacterium]